MAKKKSEETIPMQTNKSVEMTQPVSKAKPADETATAAPKARKNVKTKTVPEPVLAEPAPEAELAEPPQKRKRGGWVALGILGMLIIAFVGVAIGYASAIKVRQAEQTNQVLIVATTQYELSLQNIAAGSLDLAKRRLEYVIQIYPSFPGAADKLAEVMVSIAKSNLNVSNENTQPEVVATQDTRNQSAIFAQAQQQLASEDWANLYNSVNSLRNLDPTYEALKVDAMYYLALRNVGIANIKAGNLEKGIYQFKVAEQIAPIDADANNWRQYAIMYIDGGANWGVNWQIAVNNFSLLYQSYPYLSDFNGVTSKDRYANSLVGLGDTYESTYDWCHAKDNYAAALGIESIVGVSDKLSQAQEYCKNPPPTPTPEVTTTPGS
jgi:tetratricopeptide (TPR) repeat protein